MKEIAQHYYLKHGHAVTVTDANETVNTNSWYKQVINVRLAEYPDRIHQIYIWNIDK